MRLPLIAALLAATVLTACGGFRDSRLNPMNWFGRSQPAEQVQAAAAPTDPRALADQVLTMTVEPYPGGAIVRATGLPPTQGYWEAELVARPLDENGVLVLDFRVFPPTGAAGIVNQQSREITVAYNLSDIKLQGISEIVVQGGGNARSSRR
jgi:hypothetical protein